MVFVTQNMAPFRMQWLEALSKYIDIVVYHLNDYDSTVDSRYLTFKPKGVFIKEKYKTIGKIKFFKIADILNENADILMLDGYGFLGQMWLITILKILKKPFYISVDGGLVPEKENFFKKNFKKFFINSASGFFSTSEVTDLFINHYLNKPLPLYRHYFSTVYTNDICNVSKQQKLSYKEKLGLKDKFVVIAVGRFIPIKGFDILLKSASTMSDDVCFVFVGGKPTNDYNCLIENIKQADVKFVDFLNKEKLKEYYCASDVFALPSRGDVWGLVVGEAMSYGLPVLGSDKCVAAVSMVKDYENGFIISGENPKDYADKILELKENSNLCEAITKNNLDLIRKYAIDLSVINDINNIEQILSVKIIKE